jgi:DNA-binding CsgD family transcriptional regulator
MSRRAAFRHSPSVTLLSLPAVDGLTELDLLVSLGLSATAVAPSFCALLRAAVKAEWVALSWSGLDEPPLRYCCLGGWSRRTLLPRASGDAVPGGVEAEPLPEAANVLSVCVPRGQPAGAALRVDCVGRWPVAAERARAETTLAAAAVLLADCPRAGRDDAGPTVERDEGLLLVEADGTPRCWTEDAGRALATILDTWVHRGASVEAAQNALRRRLHALLHRGPGSPIGGRAPEPAERFETPFGTIALAAARLRGPASSPVQALRGTREVPWSVGLVEGVAAAPLSPRQKQVAFLAARGESYAGISRRLALSRPTVVDYMRGAYEKLGVASHEELAAHLVTRRPGTA